MYEIKPLPQFADWLSQLKDPMTRARLVRRLEKAERGLLGDVAPVGEGVSEMREHFGAGWRMYYIQHNGMLIVMLGGGSKATQSADCQGNCLIQDDRGVNDEQKNSSNRSA